MVSPWLALIVSPASPPMITLAVGADVIVLGPVPPKITDGPYPEAVGGLMVVEVPSREEALEWAARIAVACRCAQEVRELMPDPEQDAMLRQADLRR